MIQEITCPDSFVSISNSTVPLRRLFQQHRSFASLRRAARLRRMSAMPSIATESVRRNEPTRWAITGREQSQQNLRLLDHFIGAREQHTATRRVASEGFAERKIMECRRVNRLSKF